MRTSRGMLTALIGMVVVLMAVAAPVAAQAPQECPEKPESIGSLAVGESLFWKGAYVDTETGEGDCVYEYVLDVGPGGNRLRVAIDLVLDYRRSGGDKEGVVHPSASADDGRRFDIGLIDPGDNPVKLGRSFDEPQSPSDYSNELTVCFFPEKEDEDKEDEDKLCEPFSLEDGTPCDLDPDTREPRFTCENPHAAALSRGSEGTWKVRVDPDTSTGWLFRMRARLDETSESSSGQDAVLLPNLRAVPPFKLTFCEPQVSVGFFVAHTPVCGAASNGLTPDEEADLAVDEGAGVKRGLRFSAGPENAGLGLFEVRRCPNTLLGANAEGETTAQACQRRYRSSGEHEDKPAGTLRFHQGHAHWHYDFFRYELFRVEAGAPPPKRVSAIDVGRKVGFCPGFERLADWERFFQDLVLFPDDDCLSPTEPRMRLEAGWGDLYEWPRIEQFVEFPTNADGSPQPGSYLLQTTVDPQTTEKSHGQIKKQRQIEESDERDNTSFVAFTVCDDDDEDCGPEGLTITKSGYGLGP